MTISMTIISIAGLSISRPLAIISMVSISTIYVAISMTISISGLGGSGRLSISRSLAIISMVTIAISMTISKTISMTIITISRLSLSRPLAIVSMVTISISMSITMAISMSIIAISRLGNSHTQEGKRNSKQNVHVDDSSFSTTLPM